jgi:Xaa-Pro aminopeptidase
MPLTDVELLRTAFPKSTLEDATPLLVQVKAIKSPAELKLYEEAVAIVDAGFETFVNEVAVGRTEAELVAGVEETVRRQGALPFTIIRVLSDRMYIRPPTQRRVQAGELVCCVVEVVAPNGFWVEKGAMFALGEPPERWLEIYEAAERAHAAAQELLQPGNRAGDIARAVRAIAADAGCILGIQSGHGVGVDHDLPVLVEEDDTPLEPNMVISVHPHLLDNGYGAAIFDQYTVTASGPVRHSRFGRQLYAV